MLLSVHSCLWFFLLNITKIVYLATNVSNENKSCNADPFSPTRFRIICSLACLTLLRGKKLNSLLSRFPCLPIFTHVLGKHSMLLFHAFITSYKNFHFFQVCLLRFKNHLARHQGVRDTLLIVCMTRGFFQLK